MDQQKTFVVPAFLLVDDGARGITAEIARDAIARATGSAS